ncbi:MAG: ATPase/protein kinase [Ignavibacteria bacterium GWF2_33_9]|nr:MAG: ATPase/protein kinase [Ignavibacteria bacterium GWF2_33_9]
MDKQYSKPEWAEKDEDSFASFIVPAEKAVERRKPTAKKSREYSRQEIIEGIKSNSKVLLSKAITLVESNAASHFEIAQDLINRLLPHSGKSIRIGITGSPGAGKSTFIEAFGKYLTNLGHKVAVLAIDPTSTKSRGSILGDKTRMEELSRDKNAFIRPSPSGGTLGGVARKTRETMLLCEAAGYDVILIETVGVGQSEVTVHSMVDFFLVLLLPGAGDELQGIKKGVIELADGIMINKSEDDNATRALQTKIAYQNALHLLTQNTPDVTTKVFTASALKNIGISDIWDEISSFIITVKKNGYFEKRRNEQIVKWFNSLLNEAIMKTILTDKKIHESISTMQKDITKHKLSPVYAVHKIIEQIDKV